jgi:hypothetical protein
MEGDGLESGRKVLMFLRNVLRLSSFTLMTEAVICFIICLSLHDVRANKTVHTGYLHKSIKYRGIIFVHVLFKSHVV